MSNSLRPILNKEGYGLYTKDGRIFNDSVELMTSNDSSFIDILNFSKVPLSLNSINKILELIDIQKLVNVYITHDQNVIGTSPRIDHYRIYWNNEVSEVSGMDCDSIEDSFWSSLISSVDSYESELDDMISKMPDDDLDPMYLIEEGDISDYVSFQNNEVVVGELPIGQDTTNVRFDGQNSYFKPGPRDREVITFYESTSIQLKDRLVKSGDILELVIGFRDDSGNKSRPKNFDDIPVLFDGEGITFSAAELIDEVQFNGFNISFNGANITWGQISDVTRRVLLQVTDDIEKVFNGTEQKELLKSVFISIEDKMLVDISSDRVVIYSLSNKVTEYYIKSCRLLKISN